MTEEQIPKGWNISVPKFLLNPLMWIFILAGVAIIGYQLWVGSQQAPSAQTTSLITTTPSTSKSLGYFKKVSDTPVQLDNKPYFLYVGAQFCPFCAAERWSIVQALSNFGTWSGLGPDTSAVEEAGFSRISTYNFVNAKYESQYISYAHKETADRNGQPIPGQELADFEKKWFNQYDPRGGVPFLFLNGQYVQLSSGYSPSLIQGKTYEQVKADIENNTNAPHVTAINREADIITAYLCKATNNKPENVCNDPKIAELVVQVP
ncbi:MAG: hypothetical protein COY81_00480 [Candidatus Pacebacteria bacterium CG_4_10_14_0_8_um_filter_43_12]|uniref:DUF929 domain-containing protein n=1 Tax=Candidatus Roizmanbacteria bacterium CG_4_9_14_0_2_um_filter_39_13 TaxID=1974839 RepID=A0A2M8F4Y9_9BACT|nr:MAG: hypothetical protein COY81_00480 [Candidatus Pacebacteria bacterium CG_4_10_14_0_8_um_filter_43_12]PIZ79479.1 MAG: hypothetical protein COY01_00970 [Candidatus Pacebacteria bacterium CG_4_10_14_0_2_um_filter_40_20]PJC34357.1 MAG: hypothetical protein CO051_00065 [Candidatus Roizmanbacteria bacterium CG_4_9_14_0_2_um_filter_39_13]